MTASMIEQLPNQMEERYQEVKSLLLNPNSYEEKIDLTPVSLLLSLADSTLTQTVSRMDFISGFLNDSNERLLVSHMKPFGLLYPAILTRIDNCHSELIKLMECYNIVAPDKAHHLQLEPIEIKQRGLKI